MKIKFEAAFKRCFAKLTKEETKQTKAKIYLLEQNLYHPSLRVKKMKGKAGKEGIYRMRVTKYLRVTFMIEGDTIYLRKVGGHEKTIKKP